jgi:hypothetical protein
MNKEVGRNDPCSCGSGKKYKKCCGAHAIGRHVAKVIPTGDLQSSLLGRISAAGASFTKEKDPSMPDKVFQASLTPPSPKINSSSEQEKD